MSTIVTVGAACLAVMCCDSFNEAFMLGENGSVWCAVECNINTLVSTEGRRIVVADNKERIVVVVGVIIIIRRMNEEWRGSRKEGQREKKSKRKRKIKINQNDESGEGEVRK